jgi:predicted glutamine amidotransferase
LNLLKRHQEATEVMFHHRIPTSTINVRNACHPFSTKDYFENQYVVIHNGVLHNEDLLKKEHDKLGIQYVSVQENGRFNDSEALAYDLARYFEGQVDTLTARGSIAFIAVKRDEAGKPVCLFFGRNYGNPLKMKRTKYSLTLSSEGKGEDVEAHTLYLLTRHLRRRA